MSGLFGIIRNSANALSNFQTGLSVVQDNVANANTPGHTAKRIIFEAVPPLLTNFGPLGMGARIARVEGVRNSFLESRLIGELQTEGFFQGQRFGLSQIEALLFTSQGEGLSGQISRFFNSVSELTNDGGSLPLREAVLVEARAMAEEFRSAQNRLGQLASDNRQQISDTVERVNLLTRRIADLNRQLGPVKAQGLDGGALEDQRQATLDELAQLIDFRALEGENGMVTVSTRSGNALVVNAEAHDLSTTADASGTRVFLQGQEVGDDIRGGRLGGLLVFDRTTLPSFQDDLNRLAEELAVQVNTLLQSGEDLNGNPGAALFTFTPGGAASSLDVALDDPALLAIGAPASGPGNVDVAQQIAELRNQGVAALGGDTFGGFFSGVVFRAGLEAREVDESLTTQGILLSQVLQARNGASGVSLDEEAVKLIQLQRSYEASARVVQVVDRLLEETMNLIR